MSKIATIRETTEQIAQKLSVSDSGRVFGAGHVRKSGAYRDVLFGCDDVVYKVLQNAKHQHNLKEWRLYQKANKALRAMMAQPLYISKCGLVLAVRRIPRLLDDEMDEDYKGGWEDYPPLEKFNERLEKLLQQIGYSERRAHRRTRDNHPENIGLTTNGKWKWIDYAGGTS